MTKKQQDLDTFGSNNEGGHVFWSAVLAIGIGAVIGIAGYFTLVP